MSWRRVGTTLLIIFVALSVLYPVDMHVMVWYLAQKEARDPCGAVMARPLPISDLADLSSGEDTKASGYSLRVPWTIVKQKGAKSFSNLEFANGASVMIVDGSNDSSGPGMLVDMSRSEAATYRNMFGEQAISSKYEFLRAEFNTTPSSVSFWHSRAHNAAAMTNLFIKHSMLRDSKTLYSITLGEMHGFQVGDPSTESVWLWLFDASDRETWFICRPAKQAKWTQAQINAMIASIHIATQ